MTETLVPMADEVDQKQLAEQLLAQAKEQGVELMGPNGLLNQLTKNVLETALDAEMTEHLGYERHDAAGRGSGNSLGRHLIEDRAHRDRAGRDRCSPRDVDSSFMPQIAREAATTFDGYRRDRVIAHRKRVDDR